MSCSRNIEKVSVEPVRVNIFLILDQIISNVCLAGVHPRNSAFMIDLSFFSFVFGLQFCRFLLSALKSFRGEKKTNHVSHTQFVRPIPACVLPSKSVSKLVHVSVSKHGWNLRFQQKPWLWTSAGHISRSSSFSRSDRCRHLNSAHLKAPTAHPLPSACHYYPGTPKGRRRCFSLTVAQQ